MKLFKHLAALCAATVLLSSCSVLQGTGSNASSAGAATGAALSTIFGVLQATGTVDLGNLNNIITLGQILTGASNLTDAAASYTEKFAAGLIKGSDNLINSSNVNNVISGLRKLGSIDASALTQAAASAAVGAATKVTSSTPGVSETLSTLRSLYKLTK